MTTISIVLELQAFRKVLLSQRSIFIERKLIFLVHNQTIKHFIDLGESSLK